MCRWTTWCVFALVSATSLFSCSNLPNNETNSSAAESDALKGCYLNDDSDAKTAMGIPNLPQPEKLVAESYLMKVFFEFRENEAIMLRRHGCDQDVNKSTLEKVGNRYKAFNSYYFSVLSSNRIQCDTCPTKGLKFNKIGGSCKAEITMKRDDCVKSFAKAAGITLPPPSLSDYKHRVVPSKLGVGGRIVQAFRKKNGELHVCYERPQDPAKPTENPPRYEIVIPFVDLDHGPLHDHDKTEPYIVDNRYAFYLRRNEPYREPIPYSVFFSPDTVREGCDSMEAEGLPVASAMDTFPKSALSVSPKDYTLVEGTNDTVYYCVTERSFYYGDMGVLVYLTRETQCSVVRYVNIHVGNPGPHLLPKYVKPSSTQ